MIDASSVQAAPGRGFIEKRGAGPCDVAFSFGKYAREQ